MSGYVSPPATADLRKALASDAKALTAWEDITPLARNEWFCWTISVTNMRGNQPDSTAD